MADYCIRQCTETDAAVIARHRVAMFRDMGQVPSLELARLLREESEAALAVALRENAYVGWFACTNDDQVIAGAGAHIQTQLPRIAANAAEMASSAVPLVVNVYTEPTWRKRGIAKSLMRVLMNWAATRGFDRISLHASDAGRQLYTSLGFVPTNEMRWSRVEKRGCPPG